MGGHDKEGLTKATIGLGDVTIGGSSEVPEECESRCFFGARNGRRPMMCRR